MPLGPSVLLTRSPTAMAPTNAERRAFSPFSSDHVFGEDLGGIVGTTGPMSVSSVWHQRGDAAHHGCAAKEVLTDVLVPGDICLEVLSAAERQAFSGPERRTQFNDCASRPPPTLDVRRRRSSSCIDFPLPQ